MDSPLVLVKGRTLKRIQERVVVVWSHNALFREGLSNSLAPVEHFLLLRLMVLHKKAAESSRAEKKINSVMALW